MNPIRKAVIGAVLVGTTLTGGALGASLVSGAASATTPTTAASSSSTAATTDSTQTAPPAQADPSKGGHEANGITETLLTGTAKTKVEAAAKAAVPGGTIERVENDAEGDAFEAHVTKADGSQVTVKLDASYKVTSIDAQTHP